MKTASLFAAIVTLGCTGGAEMSPKNSATRRVVLSYETGPSMSQHEPSPTFTLYSDGEFVASDAGRDGDGHRILVLETAVIKRLIARVDEIPDHDAKLPRGKHDAKTVTWAAFRSAGTRVLLRSGGYSHPKGDHAIEALEACMLLARHY